MKTLSTLALLTLTAAAHAYTLDLQVGTGKPSAPHSGSASADDTSVIGVGIGTYLNENSHLGLSLSTRDIVNADVFVDAKARTALVEYTYELNSTGGIKPFIGAGIGYAWLKNTDKKTALASDFFAGVRFNVTQSVDLTLTARAHQLYNVDFSQVNGENNRQINSFEAVAGLRFNF
jgi:opacity protein-like surface antigen